MNKLINNECEIEEINELIDSFKNLLTRVNKQIEMIQQEHKHNYSKMVDHVSNVSFF